MADIDSVKNLKSMIEMAEDERSGHPSVRAWALRFIDVAEHAISLHKEIDRIHRGYSMDAVERAAGEQHCRDAVELGRQLAAAQERVRELASIATERRVHIIAVEAMLEAAEAELAKLREQFYVDDGFGSTWGPCPECGNRMSVMRPGKANCGHCEMVRVSGQLIEQRNALQAENAKLREQVNGLQHTCRQQQELIERAVKGGRK